MKRALLIALAACGDNLSVTIDAGAHDAATGCTARFTGNYVELSIAPGNCPSVTPVLHAAIASAALDGPLDVELELATGTPGTYTPATVATWRVLGLRRIGNGGCQLSAGTTAIPSGSFTLVLDGSHGTLDLLLYVLTIPNTDCGDGETETVHLEF